MRGYENNCQNCHEQMRQCDICNLKRVPYLQCDKCKTDDLILYKSDNGDEVCENCIFEEIINIDFGALKFINLNLNIQKYFFVRFLYNMDCSVDIISNELLKLCKDKFYQDLEAATKLAEYLNNTTELLKMQANIKEFMSDYVTEFIEFIDAPISVELSDLE